MPSHEHVLVPVRPPSPAKLGAMVQLLDDSSTTVVDTVRRALLEADRRADVHLRRASRSDRPRLRARARATLLSRERRATTRRLLGYVTRKEIDLERALFVLGGFDRPKLDHRPYVRALDAMAEMVKEEMAATSDKSSAPLALGEIIGNRLGYVGSEVDYDHPDNVHLHRAIERKRGMPLTLVAIYLFVARRAGIRAAAVPLPGHVMCRLYAEDRAYLVDPFAGGKLRTREDCVRYLALHELVPRAAWFRDARDRDLFQRHVRNLMRSFDVRGRLDEARGLLEVARTLGRGR